jgi:hypothetical protein
MAADDALKSAAEAGNRISNNVDGKFATAIHLLSGFEKDFPSKDPTSDPNISGVVTREASMSDTSKSPSAILHALKRNLHAKVKLPSVSLHIDADES